jgi:hypothetical protein
MSDNGERYMSRREYRRENDDDTGFTYEGGEKKCIICWGCGKMHSLKENNFTNAQLKKLAEGKSEECCYGLTTSFPRMVWENLNLQDYHAISAGEAASSTDVVPPKQHAQEAENYSRWRENAISAGEAASSTDVVPPRRGAWASRTRNRLSIWSAAPLIDFDVVPTRSGVRASWTKGGYAGCRFGRGDAEFDGDEEMPFRRGLGPFGLRMDDPRFSSARRGAWRSIAHGEKLRGQRWWALKQALIKWGKSMARRRSILLALPYTNIRGSSGPFAVTMSHPGGTPGSAAKEDASDEFIEPGEQQTVSMPALRLIADLAWDRDEQTWPGIGGSISSGAWEDGTKGGGVMPHGN